MPPVEKDTGVNDLDALKSTVRAELAAGKGDDDGKPDAKAVAAAEAVAAEEPDDEAVTEEADEDGEKPEADKVEKAKPVKKDWLHTQRDKFRAQAREEREARGAAEQLAANQAAELERMRALLARKEKGEEIRPEDVAKPKSEAELRAEAVKAAKAEMAEEATQREFVVKADTMLDNGVKAYGKKDFEEARDNIIGFGDKDFGIFPSHGARIEFITQLIDSVDNPERVMFLMGQDPEEADRILGLPERKRIAAFVKLSTARPRKSPVSEAPEPIEEVKGGVVARTTYNGVSTSAAVTDKIFKDTMERIAIRRRG